MNPKPDLRADLEVLAQQMRWHLTALEADIRAFEQRLQDELPNSLDVASSRASFVDALDEQGG